MLLVRFINQLFRHKHLHQNLARNTESQIHWFTSLQEFVLQSGDLIVHASLDRKPIKLLQSHGDADASSLACEIASEGALQTLKSKDVLNRDHHESRVGIIEATGDERTGNVLGAVQCEVGTDVEECTDVIETRFWKCRDVCIWTDNTCNEWDE